MSKNMNRWVGPTELADFPCSITFILIGGHGKHIVLRWLWNRKNLKTIRMATKRTPYCLHFGLKVILFNSSALAAVLRSRNRCTDCIVPWDRTVSRWNITYKSFAEAFCIISNERFEGNHTQIKLLWFHFISLSGFSLKASARHVIHIFKNNFIRFDIGMNVRYIYVDAVKHDGGDDDSIHKKRYCIRSTEGVSHK